MSDPSRAYTVGWICALSVEFTASRAFLEEKHPPPQTKAQNDDNAYILGSIAGHNIVMAILPAGEYGTASAAGVAKDMLRTFPDIRFGLMVGIGGGAPGRHDVRLGDVVVSHPGPGHGGVIKYDPGKRIQGQEDLQPTGHLCPPPPVLLTAVQLLKTEHELQGNGLEARTKKVLAKYPKLQKKHSRPDSDSDRLYDSNIVHPRNAPSLASCSQVCTKGLVERPARDEDPPFIHYGLIASGNSLMKDAKNRDTLASTKEVLCFEREAAGLMNTNFKCLVIRGICDYSDTHRNKAWQGYASLAAAAYAADLLRQIPPSQIQAEGKMDVNSILQSIEDTRQTTLAINTPLESDKIQRWLSPADPSTNANQAREKRQVGTGTWFLKSSAFQEWRSGSPFRRHLWLSGLAGCGKTVLSTAVLDYLGELGGDAVLSFFFDFQDATKQTLHGMLRALAFQLHQRGIGSTELDTLFRSHKDGEEQPTTKTLREAVRKLLGIQKGVFIVIDALDECTTRTELLSWIDETTSATEMRHIQLICAGRPEDEFVREIPISIGEQNCLRLDKNKINADIRSYVVERLDKSPEFAKWALHPTVLDNIRETIGKKSDGMFRWAACQLDSLQVCLDRETVETALQSLPRDLNDTYARMLGRILPERKHKAIRLLQFLVHSKRPLTLDEAVDILAVRLDDRRGEFDETDRMPDPREITAFCPSMVSIVQTKSYSGEWVAELHLAHLSVKEYLLAGKAEGFRGAEASINITQTCLAYLSSIATTQESPDRSFPLAKYAANIWMGHARLAEGDEPTRERILRFLQNSTSFHMWRELYKHTDSHKRASYLYYACSGGLVETTKQLLLDKRVDVNAQGGFYDSALSAASNAGHTEIVQLLLNAGADANARGGVFGAVLSVASIAGHTEIVQLLLNAGANISAQGFCGAALSVASNAGHTETVQLLLNAGADVNAQGGFYDNALSAASHAGHTEIVQLMLNAGADVNAQSRYRSAALSAASNAGHTEIVQLLLNAGVDVNAQCPIYGSALSAASRAGHTEIVQLLRDAE
ncbi:hypothetical protein RB595_001230 [Gaeumannomyces hyphopodioides]